jgi:hypothetical protein
LDFLFAGENDSKFKLYMKQNNVQLLIVTSMIFTAALSRLVHHPYNFTPIGAMALFGAAHFNRKLLAFLVPALALWLSDLVLNNVVYPNPFGFIWFSAYSTTYIGFAAIVLLGYVFLHEVTFGRVVFASLASSLTFFIITNTGSWIADAVYSKDGMGLISAWVAGIPFFWNTLLGDLFYCGVLFGGYALAKRQIYALQNV